MVAEGDNHLREQLEGLRAAHFEQLVEERATALAQGEAQEQDAVSIERAIIESAALLRDQIIEIQAKHLRRRRATKLGGWLMDRRTLPEIRFGFSENNAFSWDAGDMTVATAPLMASEEDTVDGKVVLGWVTQLESPIPEAMAWRGEEPPVHVWGKYGRSSVDIYRVAEDPDTAQTKEKWFTINPETDHISCWKLAEQRRGFVDVVDDQPILEDDQRVGVRLDEGSSQGRPGIYELIHQSEEQRQQRMQRYSERLHEQYAPDSETGLQLLGIIRGSINELS